MSTLIDFIKQNGDVVSAVFTLITIISIIVGGIFTLRQWITTQKLKRADYIINLTDKIRIDDNIVFYLFEYSAQWYDDSFHGSQNEKKVDYTLSFFNCICYLKKHRIIKNTDFKFFKYQIDRIVQNSQYQDYMYNLFHFSKRVGLPISFPELFEYTKKSNYIDKSFYDKNAYKYSSKYHHYLNY